MSKPDRPRIAGSPKPRGRRYPRNPAEARDMAGDRRVVGLARFSYAYEAIRDLEAAALEDLGGEANVGVLKREILAIGLQAESIAISLLNEIAAKMQQSRADGHIPAPSRYKAVACVACFLDLAARRFRDVGLERKARDVGTLETYLADRQRGEDGEAS